MIARIMNAFTPTGRRREGSIGERTGPPALCESLPPQKLPRTFLFVRILSRQHGLPEAFVDSLLISANGIDGKVKKLVQPVCEATGKWNAMKSIVKDVEKINKLRNQIAHSGRFMNQEEANEIFVLGLKVIVVLAPQEANGLK
jgi:hypothetical protein